MEAIGKGILIFMLMLKSFSPSVGNRVQTTGSYVPDPNRPPILRIAVIPFENVSQDTNATDRLMDTLVTYLLHTQVIGVVDPFLVDQQLFDLKIRKASQITVKMAQDMKQRLGIDAILVGKITGYQIDNTGGDSIPVIAVSARLIDLETLGIVWSVSIVRKGNDKSVLFDIGRIDTLSDLNQLVANDLASSLGKEVKTALKGYVEKSVAVRAAALPAATVSAGKGAATATSTATSPGPTAQPGLEEPPAAEAGETPQPAPAVQPARPLPDLMPALNGFNRGDVLLSAHGTQAAECTYLKGATPIFARLVDCGAEATCKALQTATAAGPLEPMPETNGDNMMEFLSKMGFMEISAARGRYLVVVSGGEASVEDMKILVKEILKLAGR